METIYLVCVIVGLHATHQTAATLHRLRSSIEQREATNVAHTLLVS